MSETSQAKLNADSDRAIAEFLAKGGEIQQLPVGKSGFLPGQATTNMWGRKSKAAVVVEEIVEEDTDDTDVTDEVDVDIDTSDTDDI